jgi:hypothetical protein
MTDENELRRLVRRAMRAGLLPRRRPDRMWGGPGHGARCAVCDGAVAGPDMAFDLEFVQAGAGEPLSLQMHNRCFAMWEHERDNASTDGNGSGAPHVAPEAAGRADRLRPAADTITVARSARNRSDSGSPE